MIYIPVRAKRAILQSSSCPGPPRRADDDSGVLVPSPDHPEYAGVTAFSLAEDKMVECQIWPDSGNFAPVDATFRIPPKVGETISVLIAGRVRSFIVTGVSAKSDRQSIRLWVRDT